MNPLSASRIKLAKQCSWQYWSRYVLKLPESTNDGASRGWIVHLVLELLAHEKRKPLLAQVRQDNSLLPHQGLRRLVMYHARRLKVDDEENIALIDKMTLNGLTYDFEGDSKKEIKESLNEKKFEIEIKKGEVNYKVLGFIDKLFLYKDGSATIRDFKTSKQVFKGSDITDNLQHLIYSLATRKLYPEVTTVNCEFLFLKFPLEEDLVGNTSKGILRIEEVSPDELEGFEYQLSETQKYLDSFNEVTALSNMAAVKGYPKDGTFGGPLACGREGFKQSRGELVLDAQGNKIPNYICPYRQPRNYYVLLNKEQKIIKSTFEETPEALSANEEEGETIELRSYAGCPHWNKDVKDEFDL